MIRKKLGLMVALFIPILALFILTVYKKHILMSGHEVTIPISGYDPRSILSGHYLRYRVEYGIENICHDVQGNQISYLCLDDKTFLKSIPKQCKIYIRGVCRAGQFTAGIEQYYIPAEAAPYLEKEAQSKNASIIISILPNGQAQVKTLLINGKPWQK